MNKIIWLGVGLIGLPFITSGLFRNAPDGSQSQIVVSASPEVEQAEQATLERFEETQEQLGELRSDLAGTQLTNLLNDDLDSQFERTKETLIMVVSARADHLLQVAREANQTEGISVITKLTQLCHSNARRSSDQAIQDGIQQYAVDGANFDLIRTPATEDHACSVALMAARNGQTSVAHQPINPGVWGDSAAYYSHLFAAQLAATQAPSIPDLDSEVANAND